MSTLILDYDSLDKSMFHDNLWLVIMGCSSETEAIVDAQRFYKTENVVVVRQKKKNGKEVYWAREMLDGDELLYRKS